jgi:hypothetical protein
MSFPSHQSLFETGCDNPSPFEHLYSAENPDNTETFPSYEKNVWFGGAVSPGEQNYPCISMVRPRRNADSFSVEGTAKEGFEIISSRGDVDLNCLDAYRKEWITENLGWGETAVVKQGTFCQIKAREEFIVLGGEFNLDPLIRPEIYPPTEEVLQPYRLDSEDVAVIEDENVGGDSAYDIVWPETEEDDHFGVVLNGTEGFVGEHYHPKGTLYISLLGKTVFSDSNSNYCSYISADEGNFGRFVTTPYRYEEKLMGAPVSRGIKEQFKEDIGLSLGSHANFMHVRGVNLAKSPPIFTDTDPSPDTVPTAVTENYKEMERTTVKL